MILQVDGIDARVEQLGAGEQVLLLHGWGPGVVSLEEHLLPLGHTLKRRYEVSMLEFPGHGDTPAQQGAWGVPDYAGWTLHAMDLLGLRRPHIVAHSFGGRVALWLAANHPDRVGRLVITGGAGLRPKRTLQGVARKYLYQTGRVLIRLAGRVPSLKERSGCWQSALRDAFSSADYLATPEGLRASFSRIVAEDLRPLLPRIAHKTLLVWGEKDTATPLWMGQAMAREMPDARLLVYQADDHFAYKHQTARFATAVDAFLEEAGDR